MEAGLLILTPDEILRKGLELVGFSWRRQQNVARPTNLVRFRAHYGSNPIVYSQIWEDLLTTQIPEARLSVTKTAGTVETYLMAIHFLKCYPTENEQSGIFKLCEKTARKWAWYYAMKLQALKGQKIVWPERWTPGNPSVDDDDNPVFIITVDGVHCRVNEPKHATLSKNPQFYSHKFNQAGVDYELGLSVFENRLVWMNGPFPAGVHDIKVFRKGLKDKIPAGKKVIADKGYRGEKAVMSTPNSRDHPDVRKFKSRARAHHESFNGRLKNFRSLDVRFRHGVEKHRIVFEAICVICQYQLENGSPLFDV